MAPQVTWEFEVAHWTVVRAGQGGDGVLGETSLKGPDTVVGRGESLAEDGDEDEDGGACEAKEQATERGGVREPTAPSLPVQRPRACRFLLVAGEDDVLRGRSERCPVHGRRRNQKPCAPSHWSTHVSTFPALCDIVALLSFRSRCRRRSLSRWMSLA